MRRFYFKLLAVMEALIMVMSLFAMLPVSAAEPSGDGRQILNFNSD